ncbi:MAG: hypothetical protein ABJN65_11875 [Parasphingorhabdus sp.]
METILLSLLLIAGSSAAESESSGVRAQAVAHARIISGEAVRFEDENSSALSEPKLIGGQTLLLPMAHSKGVAEEFPLSKLVEFH